MNKTLLPFLLSSFALHSAVFLVTNPKKEPFRLPLRRGEPFEVVRPRSGTPFKSRTGESPMPAAPASSTEEHSPSTKGITDGSEFGISKPNYPTSSRLRGEEGKVLIKLYLTPENALVRQEIVKSSGFAELDRAAAQAVERDLPKGSSSPPLREHLIEFNFFLSKPK